MNRRLLSLLLIAPTAALAADPAPMTEELPPPPPIEESGQVIEPEVTIKQDEKGTTYEYRVNGQLTLIRVVPKVGAPYYFVDSDGDGELDVRREGPVNDAVNQWILFRW
jgi:hypothetical protein